MIATPSRSSLTSRLWQQPLPKISTPRRLRHTFNSPPISTMSPKVVVSFVTITPLAPLPPPGFRWPATETLHQRSPANQLTWLINLHGESCNNNAHVLRTICSGSDATRRCRSPAALCLTICSLPTLHSTRSANKRPDPLQGVLWYYCTIGPWLVQRTHSHVRYSPDQRD